MQSVARSMELQSASLSWLLVHSPVASLLLPLCWGLTSVVLPLDCPSHVVVVVSSNLQSSDDEVVLARGDNGEGRASWGESE